MGGLHSQHMAPMLIHPLIIYKHIPGEPLFNCKIITNFSIICSTSIFHSINTFLLIRCDYLMAKGDMIVIKSEIITIKDMLYNRISGIFCQ